MELVKIIIRVNEDDPKANWPITLTKDEAKVMLSIVFKYPERYINSIMRGKIVKTKYGRYMSQEVFNKIYNTDE